MPKVDDHSYLKLCAELASCLSISLSSARRKVEIAMASEGKKGLDSRRQVAEKLLDQALLNNEKSQEETSSAQLDKLLEVLAEDDNFMVED